MYLLEALKECGRARLITNSAENVSIICIAIDGVMEFFEIADGVREILPSVERHQYRCEDWEPVPITLTRAEALQAIGEGKVVKRQRDGHTYFLGTYGPGEGDMTEDEYEVLPS